MEKILWISTLFVLTVLYDYMKPPIDILYFNKKMRPFIGIRNTLIDIFMYKSHYNIKDFKGLWKVKSNFEFIKQNYDENVSNVKRHYFHDLDKWFPKNDRYYYYKVDDFPEIKKIIDDIQCVDKETAVFAVMETPMKIPAHRAESNIQLRYQLTIKGCGDSKLITHNQSHTHLPGDEILFDHSRYHKVVKWGYHKRVTLILDVNRL